MRSAIWFQASGKDYRPSAVGYPFAKQHDSGVIKPRGKGAGLPWDYGYCEVQAKAGLPGEQLSELMGTIEPLLPKIRNAGADSLSVCVFLFGSGACDIDLPAEQVVRLASLRCDLVFKCSSHEKSP